MNNPRITPRKTRFALICTLALAGVSFGCRHGSNSDTGGVSRSVGTSPAVDGTKLTAGPATLNYLLGPGGAIHIVDVTTNKTIAATTAPPQAVITVDQSKGVFVANQVITPGPLPTGHRYEIWLDRK
jgi:hypothetical protein